MVRHYIAQSTARCRGQFLPRAARQLLLIRRAAAVRKPLGGLFSFLCFVLALSLAWTQPSRVQAVDGTWATTTSGASWGTAANWAGSVIATGTDGFADFSTQNITAGTTINLDAARTIGSIRIADAVASNDWTISGANILTLDVSSILDKPSIEVANQTLTISSQISSGATSAGAGFVKRGAGTLILSSTANNFAGTLLISGGTVRNGVAAVITDTAIVAVGPNGTWDLNNTSETINNFTGVGTVTMGTGTLTVGGGNAFNGGHFAGTISGSGGLNKGTAAATSTAGNLWLTGSNSYTGKTTLTSNPGFSSVSVLGFDTIGDVTGGNSALGNPSNAANGTIDFGGSSAATIGFAELWYMGETASTNRVFNISTTAGAIAGTVASLKVELAATTLTLTSAMTGTNNKIFTKDGYGTLNLTANASFAGAGQVNGGTLQLSGASGAVGTATSWALQGGTLLADSTAGNNATRINDAATISFTGGTLSLLGQSTGTSESVSNVTVNVGSSVINATGGTSGTSRLTLGTLTRSATGSTVNFTTSGTGGLIKLTTTAINNTTGLGYWIFNGNDWATNLNSAANDLSAFSAYTTRNAVNTFAAADDVLVNGATSGSVPSVNIDSLKIASGQTITIGVGNILTIGPVGLQTGGILMASGTGDASITGGDAASTLRAGGTGTGDLVVYQNSTAGSLTISTIISNNGAGVKGITKGGPGKLIISGTANTFTGPINLNEGTTSIATINDSGSNSPLGTASNITIGASVAGATLEFTGAGHFVTNRSITVGLGGGATVDVTNASSSLMITGAAAAPRRPIYQTAAFAQLSNGSFTKTGPGTLIINQAVHTLSGGANFFQYPMIVDEGTLVFGPNPTRQDDVNLYVNAGATFRYINPSPDVTTKFNRIDGGGTIELGYHAIGNGDGGAAMADFSGVISGMGGMSSGVFSAFQNGTWNTQTFSGTSANTYTGGTYLEGGILQLNKTAGVDAIPYDLFIGRSAQGNRPFGYVAVKLLENNQISDKAPVTVYSAATLDMNGKVESVDELTLAGGTITSGTITSLADYFLRGDIDLQDGDSNAVLAGSIPLNKTTNGYVNLSATNTATGAASVYGGVLSLTGASGSLASASSFSLNGGTLRLDNATVGNNTNRMGNSAPVAFAGGKLDLQGSGTATSSETIGAVTLNAGASVISVNRNAAQTATLTIDSVTRNAGSTMMYVVPNSSSVITFTTAPSLTNSIIPGALATTNVTTTANLANDWATLTSGNIDVYTGYTLQNSATSWTSSTTNYRTGGALSGTVPTGTQTINSLKFDTSTTGTADINATGTLVVGTGGILMASTVASNLQLGSTAGSKITSGNGLDLIVVQNSTTNSLTIRSIIDNNGATNIGLTKSGPGTLILDSTITHTADGVLAVNEGTLSIGAGLAAGAFGSMTIGNSPTGATITYTGAGTATISKVMTIGSGGATFNVTGGAGGIMELLTSNITGTGGFTVGSANIGIIYINKANNNWQGATTINGSGSVRLGEHSALPPTTDLSIGGSATVSVFSHSPIFDELSGSGTLSNLSGGGGTYTATIGANHGSSTFSGAIANSSGLVAISKVGGGTQTLTGASNTYTGGTTIGGGKLTLSGTGALTGVQALAMTGGGTLTLDNSGTASSARIADTSTVLLTGGNIFVQGNSASAVTESVGELTIDAGYNTVVMNPVATAAQNVTLSFLKSAAGALPRGAGDVVNFTIPANGGTGIIQVRTNNWTLNDGITGGFATATTTANQYFGDDWATTTGAGPFTVAVYSGYTVNNTANTWTTAAQNIRTNGALSGTNTGGTINSLKFDAGTSGTATLSGTLTIDSGGILVSSLLGYQGLTITGGVLTSPAGLGDLIVITNNFGTLTVSSAINVTGARRALTKAGYGKLKIDNASNFLNTMRVIGGTLEISAGTTVADTYYIGNGSSIYTAELIVSGGTLSLAGAQADQLVGLAGTPATLTVTAGTANFNALAVGQLNWGAGSGTVNVSGGTLQQTSDTNNFNLIIGNKNGTSNDNVAKLSLSGTGVITLTHTSVGQAGAGPDAGALFLAAGSFYGGNRANFDMTGGTLNAQRGVVMNDNSSVIGAPLDVSVWNLSGGTATVGGDLGVIVGNNGIAALNISGGTLNASAGDISIGYGASGAQETAQGLFGTGGTGTVTQTGGTVTATNVDFAMATGSSATYTVSAGSLTVSSNLVFGLGGTRTMTVNGGTVEIHGVDASTVNTTGNSAIMNGSGQISLGTAVRTFNVGQSTAAVDVDASVKLTSGSGSGLTKTGTGLLRLGNAANDYTGDTTISAGTIQINAGGGAIPNTSTVIFSAGSTTLDLNSNDETVFALSSSSGNGLVTSTVAGSMTLTVSPTSGAPDFSGVIQNGSGTVGLTKTGAGKQVLSGTNTYTGATNVNVGTLSVNGSLAAGSSVTVASGATLGGIGTINGPVTVNSGGHIAPGNSAGTETYAGGLNYSAGGIYDWELDVLTTTQAGSPPPWNFDQIFITGGNLVLGGSSQIKLIFNAADPDSDPFWNTARTWLVIDVSGSGSNTGNTNFASIDNGTWSGGTFTTTVSSGDVFLNWIPGNDSQIMINGGSQTPATGASSKTVNLGNVLLNSNQASSQQLDKTGSNATTYTVTLGGSATSTFASGSFIGGTQSATGNVGIVTSTYDDTATGTVTIDNTASDSSSAGHGSDDANDVYTVNANVGKATADDSNNLNTFGPALTATVAASGSYTGLASKVFYTTGTGAGGPMLGSEAKIMLGTNSSGVDDIVSMEWRTRTLQETPTEEGGTPATPTPLPPLAQGLFSDVVRLTGMVNDGDPSGETDPFALQMTYDYTLMETGMEAQLAQNGLLFLAWLNPTGDSGVNPQWQLSVLGNFGTGANAYDNYQGSWSTFAADLGKPGGTVNAGNLASFLGSWGVDITGHTVWAVLNHNSDFAVIPEPSTWALGLLGSVGVGLAAWRRKRRSPR